MKLNLNLKTGFKREYDKEFLFWISTLTFIGAFINAMAIMKYSVPISAITGNFNRGFKELVTSDIFSFFSFFGVILSFFLGTIISGVFFSEDEFVFGKKYERYLALLGGILLVTTVFFKNDKIYLYIVAIVTGMQNGMYISYRNKMCRTTHLTGMATELGTQIGKYLRGKAQLKNMTYGFANLFMAAMGIELGAKSFILFSMNGFYLAALAYFVSAYICYKIRIKYSV